MKWRKGILELLLVILLISQTQATTFIGSREMNETLITGSKYTMLIKGDTEDFNIFHFNISINFQTFGVIQMFTPPQNFDVIKIDANFTFMFSSADNETYNSTSNNTTITPSNNVWEITCSFNFSRESASSLEIGTWAQFIEYGDKTNSLINSPSQIIYSDVLTFSPGHAETGDILDLPIVLVSMFALTQMLSNFRRKFG